MLEESEETPLPASPSRSARGFEPRRWVAHRPRFEAERLLPEMALMPWAGHRRFAYDLLSFAEPSRVIELGVFNGTSFFAFCQAVKDAGLGTELVGIDTWQGDIHSGFYGEEVYELACRIRQDCFGGLAIRFLRERFSEALPRIEDASVDVLHIDGLHTYEAARADFEEWLPKLAPQGVVLFHDVQTSFGVSRLWRQLRDRHASFQFAHSFGLGVLFPAGDELHRRMSEAGFLDAQGLYEMGARLDRARSQLHFREEEGRRDRQALEELRGALQEERRAWEQAEAELNQRLTRDQGRIADLERVLDEQRSRDLARIGVLEQELAASGERAQGAQTQLAALEDARSRETARAEAALQDLKGRLEREQQAREELLAQGEQARRDWERARGAWERERGSLEGERAATRGELAETRAELAATRAELAALREVARSRRQLAERRADSSALGAELPLCYFVVYGPSDVAHIRASLLPALSRQAGPHPRKVFFLNYLENLPLLAGVKTGAVEVHDVSAARPAGRFGYGQSLNLLFELVEPDPVFFILNPDTVPAPEFTRALLKAFEPGRTGIAEARQWPSEHPKEFDEVTGETPWASGACLLVSSEAFRHVGGFDPGFFLYCEDVDLSWRMWLADRRVVYVRDAVAEHHTGLHSYLGDRFHTEHFYSALGFLLLSYKYFGPAGEARAVKSFEEARYPLPFHERVLEQYQEARSAVRPLAVPPSHPMVKILGFNLYHELRTRP